MSIQMSKARLEAFSDGVFAIVITLLVLELRPEGNSEHARDMILHAVPRILTFVLSFLVVGSYWVAHHRFLHHIQKVDRGLLWINLSLLMVVAFIPYPTALIGATHGEVAAVQLYGVTLMLANLLGAALWLYGTRANNHPTSVVAGQRVRTAMAHVLPVVVYTIAIAVAPSSTTIALACYVVVPAFFILAGAAVDRLLIAGGQQDNRSATEV